MSFVVFPSPSPSSGSLLVMDVRTNRGAGSQRSLTDTVATMSTIMWFGGQSRFGLTVTVSRGGVVSSTVTSCASVPTLWLSSSARQVTVVGPTGNSGGASLVTASVGSQMSLAEAVPRSTGVPAGDVHSTTRSGGATITGAVVSTTVTLCVVLAVW